MEARSLLALVDSLVALTPGTAAAEKPQRAIESLLMDALRDGGRQAGEKLVESLDNKGEARAREALACLSAIGARRTARWLASALEDRGAVDGLSHLDQQFYAGAEDLASLAITHIRRGK